MVPNLRDDGLPMTIDRAIQPTKPSRVAIGVAVGVALALAGCKIEKTIVADPSQSATSVFINDASFNPDAMVAADWDATILARPPRQGGDPTTPSRTRSRRTRMPPARASATARNRPARPGPTSLASTGP